ncbi:hypothetical protein ACPWUF_10790 [Bisgaard Taxon 46]
MSKETRKVFEDSLRDKFKARFAKDKHIKVKKNKITIDHSAEGRGELYLQYSVSGKGYILHVFVDLPEFTNFLEMHEVSYKTRSSPIGPKSFAYSLLTLNKSDENNFSGDDYGTVRLPDALDDVPAVVDYVYDKIMTIYVERIMDILLYKENAIYNVIKHPVNYSYPFLFIVFVLQKNNLKKIDGVDLWALASDSNFGNVEFNQNFLKQIS